MNILIVDDQPTIISSLIANIPFSQMGVTNVFTAYSGMEAREVFARNTVDILLADIEMPVESGLYLLQWARNKGYQFECVFLTSHPDFQYIKQALALEACDYVLQPAKYSDIRQAIEKAIEKRNLANSQSEYLRLGRFALDERDDYLRELFSEWLSGDIVNIDDRLSRLQRYGIRLRADDQISFAYLHMLFWEQTPVPIHEIADEIWQIFADVFRHVELQNLSFSMGENGICILLYPDPGRKTPMSAFPVESLASYFTIAANRVRRKFACRFVIYTGEYISLSTLATAYNNCSYTAEKDAAEIDFFDTDTQPIEMRVINLEKTISYQQASKSSVYEQVLSFINNNLDKNISCSDIAAHVFLSPDYITRIIRERTGKTLKALMTELKMTRAKHLVTSTRMPISDIALELGFSSASHFSSAFKAYYGTTPKRLRISIQ